MSHLTPRRPSSHALSSCCHLNCLPEGSASTLHYTRSTTDSQQRVLVSMEAAQQALQP